MPDVTARARRGPAVPDTVRTQRGPTRWRRSSLGRVMGRLVLREHLPGSKARRSLRWVASLAAPPVRRDEVTDGSTNLRPRDKPTEDLGGHSIWVLDEGKKEMLDPDVAVAQVPSDLTGCSHDPVVARRRLEPPASS
jgi:hypothetical protein